MLERAICEAVLRDAIRACDPAALVRQELARDPQPSRIVGLAIGKAALAMARGAGPVVRGLAITNADDGRALPAGWQRMVASHPVPDDTSLAAGHAALALADGAADADVVLALISGGASSLIEVPAPGLTLAELTRRTSDVMASGAPIQELNRVRTELSAVKGGKLARRSRAPVVTLVVSDVVGDDPRVIGSGPTVCDGERVRVIAPLARFGEEVARALAAHGYPARRGEEPITDDVASVADRLASETAPYVAWGEPTVRLPAQPGTGGRAQQLALELARRLRGTERSALVAGSDGIDGRSHAAGAYVDGATWDAIAAAGVSPDAALAACDATRALGAVGALLVTGPTGINHADVVVIG